MNRASSPSLPRVNTRRTQPLHDPRAAALTVLNRLDSGNQTLDALLDDAAPLTAELSRRDRALFNQLIYGVQRWRLRLDTVIGTYADRPLEKINPPILNILRMGLLQMLFMDRIPPSAAVNTAVDLARTQKATKAAGFVNALLRNTLRDPDRLRLPDIREAPLDHLAIAHSMPHWLVSRWIERLGLDATTRLCEAINTIPPITLRCNTLKNNPPELAQSLASQADSVTIRDDIPGALDLVRPRCPIFDMQAFGEGRFAVQDGAAQLISLLLGPLAGETVLDACAGLGGKTTHLAQLMNNRGRIVAMDNAPAKLARLEQETRRLGVSIVRTLRADLNRPPAGTAPARYDRILLDAPCSGLGVLRRNPDAKWSCQKKDIARYAERQARFLDHLAPLVKKGGCLVYAVCSMEPEENEQVVARFLKNHPNFAITGRQSIIDKIVVPFIDQDRFLKTGPHIHRMDGFFAARLERMR